MNIILLLTKIFKSAKMVNTTLIITSEILTARGRNIISLIIMIAVITGSPRIVPVGGPFFLTHPNFVVQTSSQTKQGDNPIMVEKDDAHPIKLIKNGEVIAHLTEEWATRYADILFFNGFRAERIGNELIVKGELR